jgi:hypothetical protein
VKYGLLVIYRPVGQGILKYYGYYSQATSKY